MGMIGNQPANNFLAVTKDTFNGNASSYTLSKAATTNGVAVFVENVRQIPTTAYSVSGTTLTFTGTTPAGTGNVYVLHHNSPASTATHPAAQALEATSGAFTAKSSVDISSSGNAIDFKLGGTTIGNVGVISDRVYLTAEGSHGVYLDASANNFCPSSTTGTDNNGNIDLGASFAKWKDIHLAGNVVIGTAGKGIDFSSNSHSTVTGASMTSELFDFYEEGTWTPVPYGASTSGSVTSGSVNGYYTRIGRMVHIECRLTAIVLSGANGSYYIDGLPFTVGGTGYNTGAVSFYKVDLHDYSIQVNATGTTCYFLVTRDNTTWTTLDQSSFGSQHYLFFSVAYMV